MRRGQSLARLTRDMPVSCVSHSLTLRSEHFETGSIEGIMRITAPPCQAVPGRLQQLGAAGSHSASCRLAPDPLQRSE
jgi:hypothetical protein